MRQRTRGLRVAFVLQGEGRGHLTQALALAIHLRGAGHEVVQAWVGRSPARPVPGYFADALGAPVGFFRGPALALDGGRRAVSPGGTTLGSLASLPAFMGAGLALLTRFRRSRADVVVNFYDPVTGIARLFDPRPLPMLAVGHHYAFQHPALRDLGDGTAGERGLRVLTRATALRADLRLALSFTRLDPGPDPRLRVAPPLLHTGLRGETPSPGRHLLAYALNPGYGRDLADWHRTRPDVEVHCFLEGGRSALDPPGRRFHVHDLDRDAFLRLLASCRGYVTSAGFESVCEAFYLGKPVLVVPTERHPEQEMNARDAVRAGVALRGGYRDVGVLLDSPPPDPERVERFRRWVDQAGELAVAAVEEAARRDGRQRVRTART